MFADFVRSALGWIVRGGILILETEDSHRFANQIRESRRAFPINHII